MTDIPMPADGGKNTCDRCGREAVGDIGDETLCETCYHQETSSCGVHCDVDD